MTIQVIKLKTGDEIIGDFINVGAKGQPKMYEVTNPAMLIAHQTKQGIGLMLVPYFISSASSMLEFDESDVRHEPSDPIDEALNVYNEQFGAGLQVARVMPGTH